MSNKYSIDLSIIIPVYNLEGFIEETLYSVLNHSTKYLYEVIIVDDNSSDNTKNLCLNFIKINNCPNFKVISNTMKKGVSGARNTGLDNAQGKWISFLDGDDKYLPGLMDIRIDAANKYGVEFVSTGYYIWLPSKNSRLPIRECSDILDGYDKNSEFLLLENAYDEVVINPRLVWICTCMISSSLLKRLRFNDMLTISEDTEFLLKCMLDCKSILYINRELILYRCDRNESATSQGIPGSIYFELVLRNLLTDERVKRVKGKNTKIALSRCLLKNIYHYRTTSNFILAIKKSLLLIRFSPFKIKPWLMLVASIFRFG